MANQNQDFDLFRDMKVFVGISLNIFAFTSRTIEVFLRREFGVRYLNFESMVVTFILLNTAALLAGTENPVTGAVTISSGLLLFSYAFLALGIYHKLRILWREFHGNYSIHGSSFGQSWRILEMIFPKDGFFDRLFPGFVNRFVEPAIVFFISSIAATFDPALGTFLAFAAASLLISMQIQHRLSMTRFYDAMDAKIESEGGMKNNFDRKEITPAQGSTEKKTPKNQDWEK